MNLPLPGDLRLPLPGHDDRCQVYRLEHDGRYHFAGYSFPVTSFTVNPEGQLAIRDLVLPLQRLSEACRAVNGFPPRILIGDWELSPKLFGEGDDISGSIEGHDERGESS